MILVILLSLILTVLTAVKQLHRLTFFYTTLSKTPLGLKPSAKSLEMNNCLFQLLVFTCKCGHRSPTVFELLFVYNVSTFSCVVVILSG